MMMTRLGHTNKIYRSIVYFDAVEVMDNVVIGQGDPVRLFPYQDMLSHISVFISSWVAFCHHKNITSIFDPTTFPIAMFFGLAHQMCHLPSFPLTLSSTTFTTSSEPSFYRLAAIKAQAGSLNSFIGLMSTRGTSSRSPMYQYPAVWAWMFMPKFVCLIYLIVCHRHISSITYLNKYIKYFGIENIETEADRLGVKIFEKLNLRKVWHKVRRELPDV